MVTCCADAVVKVQKSDIAISENLTFSRMLLLCINIIIRQRNTLLMSSKTILTLCPFQFVENCFQFVLFSRLSVIKC